MTLKLQNFTDILGDCDEICDSQPLSLSSVENSGNIHDAAAHVVSGSNIAGDFRNQNFRRPEKGTGQCGEFRSVDEIDVKYRNVFSYPFFNLVQSRVIEDALYSDKSMVICAPTGSGKTVVFEMAIVRLLMELEDRNENHDFKIIYMAPVKALCTERLTEWHSKFTKLGLLCIEVTGDTDVDFSQLKPYRIIITTPEKWDMLTRRWRDHSQLVEVIKLFLIDEVHILNDESRGPVLEAVVSRMKTIETSVQSTHRIEQLKQQYHGTAMTTNVSPSIRFVAVSATVSNPEDVATWLGTSDKPAVYYKFGDECRPVKLRRVVEGYHCAEGTSIFKFDLILNYKLWPIIQKYHDGKPTLIFCNTRKSVAMTAETLSREITISFNAEQKIRLTALASTIKNKKLQTLVLSGVGCHHAGLLYEERTNIEKAFRNRDLPILITTTTLAMGVNLPAHLVIIKNTQQYVSGAYQEYSISTVLQMVGRAGRPQFDTEATAVIMTRLCDKPRYQALVGGCEPLQSYLHKRLAENLNSEAALGTVSDVAQCVQWLRSTFLSVRAAKDPKRYLGLPPTAPNHHISKKIEELCVKAMNGLASSGLITMDEACCIESTEAGRLMSIFYLDLETMKHIMKIEGSESMERLLWIVCESHELADMHLRMDERRVLNALNRNNAASTIRYPMKGKITTRQMKLNCVIQAILGCLLIPDPSLNQEATKIMRIADRVCKCLVAYVTRPALVSQQPKFYTAVLNTITLAKCVAANLWENSPFVSKQLRGIGPTFSTLLATAGKVNFMLLEESHPRDLERIMNKGPPAGNILRKQISLLPKYQVTMTPVDKKAVSIQLVLLNHHNLSENMDNLTAGTAHKSYLIIGDSENVLLQLSSFSDKDLIGVYDGSITYQITRKHGFEHKIYAHCVSSIVAGIDAQCEYVFKDLEPHHTDITDDFVTKPVSKKQTTITDTFRERKRKNTDSEIGQSKEKKKRESALFEKFKNLKESFGKTSKVLKDDLDKSAVMSQKILQELTHLENPDIINNNNNKQQPVKSAFFEEPTYEINENDFMNDELMDEEKINEIINEIECEITKGNSKNESGDKTQVNAGNGNNFALQKPVMPTPSIKSQINHYKSMNNKGKRVNKNAPTKSNYSFIDLLEKNIDLSDAEEIPVQEENSFSDAIKSHIEKYLQKAKTNVNPPNRVLDLLQNEPVQSKEHEPIIIVNDSNVVGERNETGRIDKVIAITSNSNEDKLTLPDRKHAVDLFDTSKQVATLQQTLNSLDLTMHESQNINNIDNRHNIQEINEENDFPAVRLRQDNSKNDDISIKSKEDTMECKINEEYNHADNSTSLNEFIQREIQVIVERNAKNYGVVKQKEAVLDENGPNNADTGREKTSVVPLSPIQLWKEKSNLAEIKKSEVAPKQIDTVNNELLPISDNFQSTVPQNLNEKKPTTFPSTLYTKQTNEKQQFRGLELWKNYIKELPPLPIEVNNKVTARDNLRCDDFGNQKTSTQQNDNCEEQPASEEVKEDQELKEAAKTKNKGGFIQTSYKHLNTNANIRTAALPRTGKNQSLDIQRISYGIRNRERRCNEASGAFSNQPIYGQQTYDSQKQPLALSKTVSCNPELHEKQHLTTMDSIHNNRMTAIQNKPAYSLYGNENVQFNFPSTKSFTLESKNIPFDTKSTATFNNEIITHTNSNTCDINRTFCENYDPSSTNNEELYINKYTFTSTKTDVSTQETADHVVRVIRNLRIDLDITEIVSKDKKSTGNDSRTDIEEIIDKNEEYLPIKRIKFSNDQHIEQCNENTSAMQSNYNLHFDNDTKLLEKSNVKAVVNSDKSLKNQILQPLPTTEPKELTSISSTEELRQVANNKEENTFTNYKIKEFSQENKPNNVMGILQKYSNIMRNKTRNTENLTPIKTGEKNSSAAKKDKPNRPFKISDIHRLDPTPVAGLLIEKTKPVNVTECSNLLEPKDKQAHLEQNKKQNVILDFSLPTLSKPEHKYNEDLQVTEQLADISYYDPYTDVEAKDTISNIDQTMLNPITLLQCFSNDEPEDIVPPPPEFSDYSDTTLDTTADVTLPADCYEPMAWEEENDVACKETPSRSIFQDSQVELTPSKEIETWNLSEDDGSCKMYTSPGLSPYSFTIMRKNNQAKDQRPLEGSLLQSTTFSRYNRLKQFKFNHKNKFRM